MNLQRYNRPSRKEGAGLQTRAGSGWDPAESGATAGEQPWGFLFHLRRGWGCVSANQGIPGAKIITEPTSESRNRAEWRRAGTPSRLKMDVLEIGIQFSERSSWAAWEGDASRMPRLSFGTHSTSVPCGRPGCCPATCPQPLCSEVRRRPARTAEHEHR